MNLTVNIKNAPSKVDRPYIVVRFCAGELWYYGQYDDVERANDVAEGLGMATVFDNSSYNAIEALKQEQEPCKDTVSRQVVLASIKNLYPDMPVVDIFGARRKWLEKYAPYFECEKAIEQLPLVNPQEPKTIQEKQAESEKYQKAYDDGYEQGYAQARFDYEQEPKYCDRNICIKNEYNGIGCDECEVQND